MTEPAGSPDYYRLLAVNEDAPDEVIDAAFRAQAKLWHPDCGPAAEVAEREAMTRLLIDSSDTLRDSARRAAYDRQRESILVASFHETDDRAGDRDVPVCETSVRVARNKWIATALALFLGGFGAHKYYLGRPWAGSLRLALYLGCWWGAAVMQDRSPLRVFLIVVALGAQLLGAIEGVGYAVTTSAHFGRRFAD